MHPPKILSLKPKLAAPHPHPIRFDEQLPDRREKEPAQHFEIPAIGDDEI